MTLISKVNWKQKKLPKNFFKGLFFLDQVYVIRKPEVFNGWICYVEEMDHANSSHKFGGGYPLMRTFDGEFWHEFNGHSEEYEIEYLGHFGNHVRYYI